MTQAQGNDQESIRRCVSSLRIFAEFLEKHGLGISDVTVDVLRDFLQHVIYGGKPSIRL